LAAASARIIAAADEARRRIERDLHDGLQQRLVSLGLRARLAQASVPADQQELKRELASVEGRLPDRVEVGAYYIISEALANAAKHAQATAVDISVGRHGHALDLSVRDDGIGGADGSGPGLTGLADRVHALAGTMRLVSPRGGGTHLRVRLPIGPGPQD
jgi:signal transduction histidine kinase